MKKIKSLVILIVILSSLFFFKSIKTNNVFKQNDLDEAKNIVKKNSDEKEVTNKIAKLFLKDFYTFKDKNDIGGLEYIYPKVKDNFILKVKHTLYKYINSTSLEELPKVIDVKINSNEKIEYDYNDIKEAYQIKASIIYEKKLDYPLEVGIIMEVEDNKVYILEIL